MKKVWWKSRVLWMNVAIVIAAQFDSAHSWVHQHPFQAVQLHALYNIVLRFLTRHELVASKKQEAS